MGTDLRAKTNRFLRGCFSHFSTRKRQKADPKSDMEDL